LISLITRPTPTTFYPLSLHDALPISPHTRVSSPCNRSGSTVESATLAAVATAVWMIFVLLSTPTCAFIPKYHCLPFFVWCISGSRCCSRFLVEVGACRMVASTIVPVVIRTPALASAGLPAPRSVPPVGVLPASAGTCTPWFRPAPAHSLDLCPRTVASPPSHTAPLPPPGPTG